LGRVRVNIMAMEKQYIYYVFWMCVCILRCPARNTRHCFILLSVAFLALS
jgi:hypothetical protein